MGKYTNGPGWTDIEIMLRALDGLHSGKTGLVISADGTGGTGGLLVSIATDFVPLPGGREFPSVVSVSSWPCKDCATLEDHIYGGLYRHDANIQAAYEQLPLPE